MRPLEMHECRHVLGPKQGMVLHAESIRDAYREQQLVSCQEAFQKYENPASMGGAAGYFSAKTGTSL